MNTRASSLHAGPQKHGRKAQNQLAGSVVMKSSIGMPSPPTSNFLWTSNSLAKASRPRRRCLGSASRGVSGWGMVAFP